MDDPAAHNTFQRDSLHTCHCFHISRAALPLDFPCLQPGICHGQTRQQWPYHHPAAAVIFRRRSSGIGLDRIFPLEPAIDMIGPAWGDLRSTRHTHPVKGCRLCDFFLQCLCPLSIGTMTKTWQFVPWFPTTLWDCQRVSCLLSRTQQPQSELSSSSVDLSESWIVISDKNHPRSHDNQGHR